MDESLAARIGAELLFAEVLPGAARRLGGVGRLP